MSGYDLLAEAAIPGVPLETILCTEKLRSRPCRAPDYEKENRALVALASALVDSQSNILQTLAETILEVTQSDSSGLSLLTKDDGGKRFYWAAIAGMWKRHIGGGTPRDFGPCGDVLDRNSTLLFQRFERRYRYFLPITPLAEECLLIPFYVGGTAVGTIWAIMHGGRRHFDAEDERLMSTLGRFASLAYQTVASIEDLKMQIATREKAEAAVRQLNSGLQAKIRRLVDSNIIGVFIWDLDGSITEANEAFLRLVGYDRGDLLSGRMSWKELTPPEWREADDRRVAELRATGAVQPYEKEYFLKCGSRVPVLIGAALFKGGDDEGLAFVLDLTERKRAEQALRESEAKFRAAIDGIAGLVAIMAPSGEAQAWATDQLIAQRPWRKPYCRKPMGGGSPWREPVSMPVKQTARRNASSGIGWWRMRFHATTSYSSIRTRSFSTAPSAGSQALLSRTERASSSCRRSPTGTPSARASKRRGWMWQRRSNADS